MEAEEQRDVQDTERERVKESQGGTEIKGRAAVVEEGEGNEDRERR